ncbi:GHKL domain-containing protein [Actinomyces sp. MRS3W]|uniref:GHKL domain-containing protein n=1 Tax=Actinomyces sp. MRS3W TaxID=2800796 RepID=UPI0028FDA259|nr:GHKL domain-containing protein [Actinomyces sp. MRS3W]MDU0349508.1 GHKL domain-containing protein [Actinomyces sp. MRS3W]
MIQEALPDIPRLWTALAEWGACLLYVLASWRPQDSRRRGVIVMALSLPALCGYQVAIGHLPISLWLVGMFGAVAAMWGVLHLALSGSLRRSTYLVVRAFVVAELVASLEWQLEVFFLGSPPTALSVVFLIVADTAAGALIYRLERPRFRTEVVPTTATVAGAAAIAAITFAMSNLSFLSTATPFSGRLGAEVFYIRTLIDLCGFVILYAQREVDLQSRAACELATSEALLHSQYAQYLTSKRAVDLVNRKYHDLRHLIAEVRAEKDPATRLDRLEELEQSIRPYGAFMRTGNPVLDVILTDKEQACLERRITLNAIADGAALGFVTTRDLVTIAGSALDHALEAVSRLPDAEDRWIRFDMRRRRGFVLLEVENPVAADGETPLAAKPAPSVHGFRIGPIRSAAAGYGGQVTAGTTSRGTFTLRVLLPLPDSVERRPAAATG